MSDRERESDCPSWGQKTDWRRFRRNSCDLNPGRWLEYKRYFLAHRKWYAFVPTFESIPNRTVPPVLLIVFNRPSTTQLVFDAIRLASPTKLYIAADGPRHEFPEDFEKVEKVRRITSQVDWECEVKTLFQAENLGCKSGLEAGLDWFFSHEKEGIVLEDDCLPSQTFFGYCAELLEKYRDDSRIWLISGHNKVGTWRASDNDYFFSFFGGIWGWATWRRAWDQNDPTMKSLEGLVGNRVLQRQMGWKLGNRRTRELLRAKRAIQDRRLDSWAYPWAISRHEGAGLACVPSLNLVENIGFDSEATHTYLGWSARASEISLPLRENKTVVADRKYDWRFLGGGQSIVILRKRIFGKLSLVVHGISRRFWNQ